MRKISAFFMLVGVTALFLGPPLTAQSIWVGYDKQKTLALEILKPDFEGGNTTFFTSALFASVYIPATEKISVVGELPVAHFGSDQGDISQTTLGNPYLGVEIYAQDSRIFAELGVRAPLAPDDDEDNGAAALTGLYADLTDRLEAFISDAVPVTAALNYRYKSAGGFALRLRGGTWFLVATGNRQDSEWGLNYGAQAWYEGKQVRVGGGLTGRAIISEEGNLGERTIHQLGLHADLLVGQARPGLYFRLPLDDDWSDIVNFVFGLKFDVRLK